MAQEKQAIELGALKAVRKQFKDRETGEVREYFGYEVEFDNGAKVRFVPLQDDRSLLRFAMEQNGFEV